jgi:hypothetical protein
VTGKRIFFGEKYCEILLFHFAFTHFYRMRKKELFYNGNEVQCHITPCFVFVARLGIFSEHYHFESSSSSFFLSLQCFTLRITKDSYSRNKYQQMSFMSNEGNSNFTLFQMVYFFNTYSAQVFI